MKRLLITLFLLSTFASLGRAQNASPAPVPLRVKLSKAALSERLNTTVPRLMKAADVPGLSIAVIKDGKVFLNQGYGVKNATAADPVTDNTVFEAASLSKPVFAYAALKLVDAGKLDLDKPLVQYLGESYIKNDDRINLITARRVLTHSTGFPNWRGNGQDLKIVFPPGERFSYSGEGFVFLQKVIEKVTGQPLDTVMKQLVFEPLGMTSSSYVWRADYQTTKATGHDFGGNAGKRREPKDANAAASLQTTSLDYAKFMIAVMNGAGLKKSTSTAMLSPQMKVDEGCSNCVNRPPTGKLSTNIFWGFGVGLQQTSDGTAFWHWGDNGDVHCYMLAYPKSKIGVAIFTNSGNGHSIIPEIINESLGGEQPVAAWLHYESYRSPGRTFYKDVMARGVAAVNDYHDKKKSNSAPYTLTESQVNQIGYVLLYSAKKVPEAIAVFKMNVEDFPESSNTYDSLGEAYDVAGEKELAIKNYEKSVELNPKSESGLAALKKLKGQ